ncbi:MAG: XRE family transcriptional regulator [Anaerolineae bacterium]|nr:XRE family transcriptional regulator [Anaerolineae bacterium]
MLQTTLGKRIRALRHERGLTLAQLGQRITLSASYLSQIERDVTMPSLSRLTAIADALGVEVGYFFEDDVSAPYVVRANQGQRLENESGIIVELLAANLPDRKLQPYCMVCPPGASSEGWSTTHPGEEVGFVLKGQLTVAVGEETFVLEAGDSIHYQTLQPHSWRNEGDEECIVVWIVSPPVSEAELEAKTRCRTLREEGGENPKDN